MLWKELVLDMLAEMSKSDLGITDRIHGSGYSRTCNWCLISIKMRWASAGGFKMGLVCTGMRYSQSWTELQGSVTGDRWWYWIGVGACEDVLWLKFS